jgi:leucyl-tRNA synthetase
MTVSPPTASGQEPLAAYDPAAVEQKWQQRWLARGTHEVDLAGGERPFYQLMMFPYPSAEGLHVGNLFAFTGTDIQGRYMRQQGRTVFEPLGFDAFGIHSENYALKMGVHPMTMTPRNVGNFRRQLERAGLMIDWRMAVDTSQPDYYRWTQWVFLQLLKQGLAYKKKAAVNWCPTDKTVLANEQVEGGLCERCGTPVEQRFLEQWFFRISDYAGRLLQNLDWLDWSETTKTAQRNWIGRSQGAQIDFLVPRSGDLSGDDDAAVAGDPMILAGTPITVFTTRVDTIFGATYLGARPRASAGRRADDARPARRRRALPRRHRAPGRHQPQGRQGEDRRLHRLVRAQPGHRGADPGLDRRLRADGVRHRRHHGRAGAR